MPSAAYFRRQADICLRLSLIASDDNVSNRLVSMAREYMATSEALERERGGDSSSTADPGAPAEGDMAGMSPDFPATPDLSGSGAES
jgi:hypothetical protein